MKRLLPALIVFLFSAPALAVPVTYSDLLGGQVTVLAFQGGSQVSSAVADISFASATVDTDTNTLLALDIFVAGPVTLTFDPAVNGLESVEISDALLATTIAAALSVLTVVPNYVAQFSGVPSEVSAAELILTPDGGAPIVTSLEPPVATVSNGTLIINGGTLDLTINGAAIGSFDPIAPSVGAPVDVIANYTFQAAVPEPSAAALFSVGALTVIGSVRRRPQGAC